ncbi:MAG TPA: NAD(P)/FAD-dependent oxidoreductase [Candidatus Acidoferrales bacterium]|nr:NAD(P)/FAD-dependent oxidoreductase [Candidatus Acidoferrales bacterium]
MDACDILIVGAGPAGSSCAWALRDSGLKVAILDRRSFPRDKVCGGWITPAVLEELQFDAADYSRGRVFQPITGFRTSSIGGPEVRTDYAAPVSYGIRRCEFDDYLLRRSGARILEPAPLSSCEPTRSGWVVNGRLETRLLIGAGGHFCPVARLLGADARQEVAVAAQEAEFELDFAQRDSCPIQGEIPELYFCRDMKGYGWCFRKRNYLNIGLGRLDHRELPSQVSEFVEFLKRIGRLPFDLGSAMRGHAYLIYRKAERKITSDNVLLIGDAAGLAYSQSGEGIRPAIESGLLAARAILAANGDFAEARLSAYRELLRSRFGASSRYRKSGEDWSTAIGRRLPEGTMSLLAATLLKSRWFTRHIVIDKWFLHRHTPALSTS